ncbi:MAG: hypothetical protein M9894_14525 [Planctomycetes bacterium]|nr:hypothetical protein [Planctomycetota bacterium]
MGQGRRPALLDRRVWLLRRRREGQEGVQVELAAREAHERAGPAGAVGEGVVLTEQQRAQEGRVLGPLAARALLAQEATGAVRLAAQVGLERQGALEAGAGAPRVLAPQAGEVGLGAGDVARLRAGGDPGPA